MKFGVSMFFEHLWKKFMFHQYLRQRMGI